MPTNPPVLEAIGKWHVTRHSGRRGDPWRLVIATDNAEQARKIYERKAVALRQGSVRLYSPDGECLFSYTAPNLRTRW